MSWSGLGDKFDRSVGRVTERVNRRLTRRDALRTAVLGGAASVAAVTLGQKPALAVDCQCGPTPRCNRYDSSPCPKTPGCPTGFKLCKNRSDQFCSCINGHGNTAGSCCLWSSGNWIACTGLGSGHGYKVCSDCVRHNGCSRWCTCLSNCVCCTCTTAEDIRREQLRLSALAAE